MPKLEAYDQHQRVELEKYKAKIRKAYSEKMEEIFSLAVMAVGNFVLQLETELHKLNSDQSVLPLPSLLTNFEMIFDQRVDLELPLPFPAWEAQREKTKELDLSAIFKHRTSIDQLDKSASALKAKGLEGKVKEPEEEKRRASDTTQPPKSPTVSKQESGKSNPKGPGLLSKITSIFKQNNPDAPTQAHLEEETEAVWDPVKKRYIFKGEPEPEDEGRPKSPPKKGAVGVKTPVSEKPVSKTDQSINNLIKPVNLMKRRKDAKKGTTSLSAVEGTSFKAFSETESLYSRLQEPRPLSFLEKAFDDKDLVDGLKINLLQTVDVLRGEWLAEFNARKKSVDLTKYVRVEEHQGVVGQLRAKNRRLEILAAEIKQTCFAKIIQERTTAVRRETELRLALQKSQEEKLAEGPGLATRPKILRSVRTQTEPSDESFTTPTQQPPRKRSTKGLDFPVEADALLQEAAQEVAKTLEEVRRESQDRQTESETVISGLASLVTKMSQEIERGKTVRQEEGNAHSLLLSNYQAVLMAVLDRLDQTTASLKAERRNGEVAFELIEGLFQRLGSVQQIYSQEIQAFLGSLKDKLENKGKPPKAVLSRLTLISTQVSAGTAEAPATQDTPPSPPANSVGVSPFQPAAGHTNNCIDLV